MNKEFIPYEQALALKELGFDKPCFMCWEIRDGKYIELGNFWKKGYRNSLDKKVTSAPTYSQAFRWFREKYELFGEVIMYIPQKGDLNGCFTYISSISTVDNYSKNSKVDRTYYKSHEEAEQACLKQLIKIVKEKK